MKLSKLLTVITIIAMVGLLFIMGYYTLSLERSLDDKDVIIADLHKTIADKNAVAVAIVETNSKLFNDIDFQKRWVKPFKEKSEDYCEANVALKYVMQNLYELEQAGYVEVTVDGIIIKGEK